MTDRLFSLARRLLAAGVVLVAGTAARADQLTATFNGTDPYQIVSVGLAPKPQLDTYAGPFNFTTVATDDPRFAGSFKSFCGDLAQQVDKTKTYTYQIVPSADLPSVGTDPLKAARLQTLFDRHFTTATTTDATNGAAFQLALWDTLYDGTGKLGLSDGDFTAAASENGPTDGIDRANSWLAGLDTPLPTDPTAHLQLVGLYSNTAQDQLTAFPPVSVPAPAGLVLAAVGGGLLLVRRLTARKAATAESPVV